jgi:hypothetical protein
MDQTGPARDGNTVTASTETPEDRTLAKASGRNRRLQQGAFRASATGGYRQWPATSSSRNSMSPALLRRETTWREQRQTQ